MTYVIAWLLLSVLIGFGVKHMNKTIPGDSADHAANALGGILLSLALACFIVLIALF